MFGVAEGAKPGETDDLATLAKLDEKILLNELKVRYEKKQIYTNVGDILVSINPFADLGIYGKEQCKKYQMIKRGQLPPHIYAVADSAYQALLGYGTGSTIRKNQCILISGESGAGKTESTKLIIKQLIELCKGNTQLEQQILQVNPLLEAFGNAQTVMNDNSSRFGKYIQLKFQHGAVMGAKISEYLLEKSRVIRQSPGEENFHVFYYMFAGLSPEELQKYQLKHSDSYRYFTDGAMGLKKHFKRLKEEFDELVNAADMVGFTDDEQEDMFTMLSSILTLGNIDFETNDDDHANIADQNGPVKIVANLLGLDQESLAHCMTQSKTTTRGETITRFYTKDHAEDARDAIAKALYGRLFSWIVNKVNCLLAPQEVLPTNEANEIGILDIFGFEHFENNSFEQACINLANEQLQFFFNQHIFKLELVEYEKEGVDCTQVTYVDNQPLLDLFTAKPIGLLALLDEESYFPKATDHSLVEKFNKNFAKNTYYTKSKDSTSNLFKIAHYAGSVEYSSDEWLEKNRDTLPSGVMEMLQDSHNDLVRLIFRGTITRTGTLALQNKTSRGRTRSTKRKLGSKGPAKDTSKRNPTVGGQFKNSLQVLMEKMTAAVPHFIRCVKPNTRKAAKYFDDEYVERQLLYTGMLETTKIRREGFAIRPTFTEFVQKYQILLCQTGIPETKEGCRRILSKANITGWQLGKTKVFLKYYHLDQLAESMQNLEMSARVIQKNIRGFVSRQHVKKMWLEAHQRDLEAASFISHVESMGLNWSQKQEEICLKDKKIPEAFFKKCRNEPIQKTLPPPFEPAPAVSFIPEPVPIVESKEEEASSDEEVVEDDYQIHKAPVANKYGPKGTRQASVRWFKETQTAFVQSKHGEFYDWFHGIITRRSSEQLLTNEPIGAFLVRVSESRFGYSLSFKAEDRIRHYMIDQLRNGKYIIVGEPKVHRSLAALISYHQQYQISNYSGLLTTPCGQEEGSCDYEELMTGVRIPRRPFQPTRNMQQAMEDLPPPLPPKRGPNANQKLDHRSSGMPSQTAAYDALLQHQEQQREALSSGRKKMSTSRSKLGQR